MEAISKFYLFYYSSYFKVVFFGGGGQNNHLYGLFIDGSYKRFNYFFSKGVLKRAVEV
jgi:hypothetical protein